MPSESQKPTKPRSGAGQQQGSSQPAQQSSSDKESDHAARLSDADPTSSDRESDHAARLSDADPTSSEDPDGKDARPGDRSARAGQDLQHGGGMRLLGENGRVQFLVDSERSVSSTSEEKNDKSSTDSGAEADTEGTGQPRSPKTKTKGRRSSDLSQRG